MTYEQRLREAEENLREARRLLHSCWTYEQGTESLSWAYDEVLKAEKSLKDLSDAALDPRHPDHGSALAFRRQEVAEVATWSRRVDALVVGAACLGALLAPFFVEVCR